MESKQHQGGGTTGDEGSTLPPSNQTNSSNSDSDSSSSRPSIGCCLYIWWGILASTAYVYDCRPIWAFAALTGISIVVTFLKLIWRRTWFLTLRARCCSCCDTGGCCGWWRRRKAPGAPQETTTKQHSPWRKQISLFFEMALPYFRESKRGKWLFIGMILLTLLDSAVNVVFSYVSKEFYNALEHKDWAAFQKILIIYTAILVGGAPVTAFYNFQRGRLAIAWRDWMTNRTLDLYAKNRVYYLLDKDIDNPDQRIAQDVNTFTTYSLRLIVTLLDNTINLISFSVILYTIEPQLFLVIIAYTFVGTVVTMCIGGGLVPLNFERLKYEADFRYSLVRMREHAESIAFYRGEGVEVRTLRDRLGHVLDRQRDIIGTERNLECFTSLYRYLTWVLPIAMVAPHYFEGLIELGVVTQARSAFLQVVGDLSIIVEQFNELSAFSAGIDRLSSFYRAIREADTDRGQQAPLLLNPDKGDWDGDSLRLSIKDLITDDDDEDVRSFPHKKITLHETSSTQFALTNLTLVTPDDSRTLIRNLTVPHQQGDLLITGPSGVGKSSLLRAIAGLWTRGDGIVERPRKAYFLPQQPYCTLGSLRNQLLYPEDDTTNTSALDGDLIQILTRVGLRHLASELSVEIDWSHRLSLGEQQRLAFGRVLMHRPQFVLLDEATSALGLESEQQMYGLLLQHNVRYVSVGHRPSLWQYHDRRLQLIGGGGGDGGYEISTMMDATATNSAPGAANY